MSLDSTTRRHKKIETSGSSDVQIFRDSDGFRVYHGETGFPEAVRSLKAALDLKKRIETLIIVHESCKKIGILHRECQFYGDAATLIVGGRYRDMYIDSGMIPFFKKTTALTNERLIRIFGAEK